MELAQHILVHSLAIINIEKDIKKVKERFEDGKEFCMQIIPDILQLEVRPKSKYPTHFVNSTYAKYGFIKNKPSLVEYYNVEKKQNQINYHMDFESLFKHNKDIDIKLLRLVTEHLTYDQVADDMYFVRLAHISDHGFIQSNETSKELSKEDFVKIKKYLNILITRLYIRKIGKYGINLDKNIIKNWCKSLNSEYSEDCIGADKYLKEHLDSVLDVEVLSDEYILERISPLVSLENLELELETQMKICTKLVTGIYKCKNSDELQKFINTILLLETMENTTK